HFLLDYQRYRRERHKLTEALGHKASSPPYLLSNPHATPHLTRFINATGRLCQT
ncbi:uncharacterized protein EDB93DRAFT_1066785, partial [Suillus bovinus]|uniref:uncharacterized protein n=1 Tax=Suillus bovinus TaxID=48563 RepID=UPI001B8634BD